MTDRQFKREDPIAVAWKFHEDGDFDNALRAWEDVHKHFPRDFEAYRGTALTLKKKGDYESADFTLSEGLKQHPQSRQLLVDHAYLAHEQKNWLQALERWEVYYRRYPEDYVGFLQAIVALRELQRYDEADALVQAALETHPDNSPLLANRAWVAQGRRDWDEALKRWTVYHEQFLQDPIGYSSMGVALRELGRYDEANTILEKGLERFPYHRELIGNYAWVAFRSQDWPEALKRWTKYRDQFPADPLGHSQTMLILGELGRFEDASILASGSVAQIEQDPEIVRLMFGFESLGDNCEFGVVQRHYGAEPLGLLRFTSTPLKLLIMALKAEFAGVGDPDSTMLTTHNGEYVTNDKRYHMHMHTFIQDIGDDRQKRFVSVCRRIRFLREKLLQDLKDAEKIFVYSCREAVDVPDIRELWNALRRYGDNRLLFVRSAPDQNAAGSVVPLETTLVAGFVDKLSVEEPSYVRWLEICRQARFLMQPRSNRTLEEVNSR